MTKKIIIAFAFLIAALSLQAQQSIIKGKITTEKGDPIPFATAILLKTDLSAVSDENGEYAIKNVPLGEYNMKVSFVGFNTVEKKIVVASKSPSIVNVTLIASSIDIDGVTITAPAVIYAAKKTEVVARMPLKNLENPQVYTILPKELIQAQVVTDYQSALNSAPGLSNITYGPASGGVGLWAYMRGFSTFAGAIRNGLATNFATLADPYNTERLEVIKGPSGTLFGSTLISYGGLINRETKKPFSTMKGEVGYTVGSWDNNRITADINLPVNEDLKTRFNAFYQSENTFQNFGKNTSMGITSSSRITLTKKLTLELDAEFYNTNRNSTFVGVGNKVTVKKFSELNLDPKISYANDEIQSKIKTFNVFAKATYKFSDQWESQTLLSAAHSKNGANYLFLNMVTNDSLTRSYMHIPSTFNAINVQQNFIGQFNIGSLKNRLLIGFDYSRNASSDHRSEVWPVDKIIKNIEPAYFPIEKYNAIIQNNYFRASKKDWRTTSIYISDVVNFTGNLLAMASVRADFFADKGTGVTYTQNTVSPKFGIVYQPFKEHLSLFANYMNGFKNISPGTSMNAKKQFKPEQANQMEVGLKAEFFDKKISGTMSYYNISVKDKVRPDPENPKESIQDGTRESKGFEMDLITNPFNGFEMIFGYGYNESKYVKAAKNVEGKRPYGVPQHVGNFWTSYKLQNGMLKGLGIGLGGNIQSEMLLNDFSDIKADGYHRLDASVFYEQEKFRLGLKLNNFTNQTYFLSDYWGQLQNPRQFLFSVTYKF